MFPLENRPGLISLLAGKPNAETFPITSLQFTMRDPAAGEDVKMELTPDELQHGLQYTPTNGLPELREWVFGLQEFQHNRYKGEGWTVSVGAGSQDLIFKAASALLNPGDAVLVEAPAYAGTIAILGLVGCEHIEVETDTHGIQSSSLRSILENWPKSKSKPKVLYTVPYGCNPAGTTATLDRRLEVLKLSREHDFLIFEDDPYYNLYFGPPNRPPSYFALERSQSEVGRVVRFDSFSKILSSGIRVGFASGPESILQAMDQHSTVTNLQPSSLGQALALKVVKAWGYEGFASHTANVAAFYRAKRDVFEAAMQRHLAGLAEWATPEAGMFFWYVFKLLGGDDDSASLIRTKALEHGVLALPGTVFYPNGRTTAFVRASFSTLSPEQVDEALRRLREVILDERKTRGV
ncbi:hypothetical protein POSPLADRAFT_1155653 [Postia placenta MAD-698-R-SB12]|uniref:Aminotransferase class I/classII large domain-containing protein n=1 Tax=Postia placenta MAD-698-R-SB12 TaxID=670580 RepID=A0A1X6MMN5_9APHY|nr:hypothetical protein POSPLADRAFT_1155653 [Postia placenta MAD-698-R-SB12]OSX57674.1 hypothetical protein POSPLADRAFT_1155653 [Postia placenta MAD-698-R-SB12]